MLLKLGGASIGLRTLLKNFSEALLPSYNAPFAGARSVIGKNEQKPKTTCANAISWARCCGGAVSRCLCAAELRRAAVRKLMTDRLRAHSRSNPTIRFISACLTLPVSVSRAKHDQYCCRGMSGTWRRTSGRTGWNRIWPACGKADDIRSRVDGFILIDLGVSGESKQGRIEATNQPRRCFATGPRPGPGRGARRRAQWPACTQPTGTARRSLGIAATTKKAREKFVTWRQTNA